MREGDRVVAASSAPCGACPPCRAERPNLCDDLLFVNGAYGEFIALPPRLVSRNVVPLAASLPAERAAFAEPLACALLAIERARVEAGQTVVVFGQGPLGCLLGDARDVARGAGRHGRQNRDGGSIGSSTWASRAGSTRRPPATWSRTSAASPPGAGAEVVIEATGRPEVWEQAVDAVGRGGTVVFFGGCAPGTSIRLDTRRAHYEELALLGAFHHTPGTIRRAVEALQSGALVPDSLITHRMRLDEVGRALDLMARGEALKVLIEP